MAQKTTAIGCLVYLGIAVLAAIACCLAGVGIGCLIAPAVDDPIFIWRLAALSGIDAIGVVALCYSRSFEGRSATSKRLPPVYVALNFMVLGMMFNQGNGFLWLFAWGVLNATIGLAAWFVVVGRASGVNC